MENSTIQPINQTPTKSNFLLVMVLSILLVITMSVTIFFAFQIKLLNKQLAQYQLPTPTPLATNIPNEKCVNKHTLNCAEEEELSFYCSYEYTSWAILNCPGWEDKVYCSDPRPEVCTLECTDNVCGSDGKRYCSPCQACSNMKVNWYEIKTSVCEKE